MKSTKFIPLILLLIFIILISTFSYMQVERWTFAESLYMSVITLTTVGYGEIHPLSSEGKILNIFLILLGVGTMTFIFTRITVEVASIDFEKRKREKMKKEAQKLVGHTIVCGYGRMGEIICNELSRSNSKFVIIEKRPDLINEIKKEGHIYIEGDAANDETLLSAGIEKAKVLVSALDSDSDALYLSIAGRSLNVNLFIIVRGNDPHIKSRLIRAGANKVVLPYVMTGLKVAETVINPAVEDLFDITGTNDKSEGRIQLADLYVRHDSKIVNKSLLEVGPMMKELIVVGVKKTDQRIHFNPKADYVFQQGDYIITLGPIKEYLKARDSLDLESRYTC